MVAVNGRDRGRTAHYVRKTRREGEQPTSPLAYKLRLQTILLGNIHNHLTYSNMTSSADLEEGWIVLSGTRSDNGSDPATPASSSLSSWPHGSPPATTLARRDNRKPNRQKVPRSRRGVDSWLEKNSVESIGYDKIPSGESYQGRNGFDGQSNSVSSSIYDDLPPYHAYSDFPERRVRDVSPQVPSTHTMSSCFSLKS